MEDGVIREADIAAQDIEEDPRDTGGHNRGRLAVGTEGAGGAE